MMIEGRGVQGASTGGKPVQRPASSGVLRAVVAGVLMGAMVVVFVISFAAIIYSGEMASELSRGLGMILAGGTIMALIGAFTLSYSGTIVQPQDVTTIILSLAVGSVAADWTGSADGLFATVAMLVATTAALTGVLAYLAGLVRLGFTVRFMPYPVLGGFLAATGLLILFGALGMAAGGSVDLWTLGRLFEPGAPVRWLPWIAYAVVLAAINRRFQHWLVLPGCILAGALAFYLILWATGGTLASASAAGLLLGPFEGQSLAEGLGPWILAEADWSAVSAEAPTMLTVAGMAIVGALLNASALGLAVDREIDPNRDLRGIGLANIGAALGGGMVGYHVLTPTIFARSLGLTSAVCGIAVACFSAVTLFFGASFLSVLPVGIFAGILLFIAIDMLYTWLWQERRKLPARDQAIVVLILAVSASVGFLEAIAVGLVAASLLFIVAYSRVDVVRLRSSAGTMRSSVERPEHELQVLAESGRCSIIYQLSGYIFFGTATGLIEELSSRITDPGRRPRFILLDLRRVTGMDASAVFALGKLNKTCVAHDVSLILTGLTGPLRRQVLNALSDREAPTLFEQFDEALRVLEERLLSENAVLPDDRPEQGFLEELHRRHPTFHPERSFRPVTVVPGEEVLAQGSAPDGMMLLVAGRLRAEIIGHDSAPIPVGTIRPGTLVGEIGLYANVPRAARVVAEQRSRLLVVDAMAFEDLARSEPALLADFHRLAAAHLARRLMRTNALLRDAEA